MRDEKEIGVITEIGDLGLGFSPLSEEDQEIVREAEEADEESK